MALALLEKLLGDPNVKEIKKINPFLEQINALEPEFEALSDTELKAKTDYFKQRLQNGETLDDILSEAFATIREAAKRVLGQRHYDVQILGGIVLHQGKIAEMKTGEGKTLTSTLAIYLNALSGKGVHVVTVNDYLSRRDADWMGMLYHWMGLSIGCIQNQMVSYVFDPGYRERTIKAAEEAVAIAAEAVGEEHTVGNIDDESVFKVDMDNLRPVERPEAYQADITYGTNNEFGFDYLRDNMVQDEKDRAQKHLSYAIIDEVDSILIDEARTPLIISGAAEAATDQYFQFAKLVAQLEENVDYNVDEKMRAATLTDEGINKMENWLGLDNIYEAGGVQIVHHIEQALKANTLFTLDKDYVVKDGEVVIVDEFTGRMMPGRRYSEGLHQAIEAKQGLDIKRESRTLATVTFQNLFRLYDKLAGMTGTADTEKEEFYKIYQLDVVVIPTNKPIIRKDITDAIYRTEKAKFQAVIKKIKQYSEKGNPVLVGTISIERNEMLAKLLSDAGIEYNLLNAKNHQSEAEVIAQAGKKGAVTIATNMAGRGVDIILGGNPYDEKKANEVKDAGGLVVLGTERHEARRIDNQLRGRSGRQGDPGETQFFVSMEDDLMRIFATDRVKSLMNTLKWPDDMPIENKIVSRSIETAQKKVEGRNFDVREHLVKYDDVITKHREVIYKKRDEILYAKQDAIREIILDIVEAEIENVVSFHTNLEDEKEWNVKEIYETVNSIFPVDEKFKQELDDLQKKGGDKLQDAKSRTRIVEHIFSLATARYEEMTSSVDDPEMVYKIEKSFYLRAIDTLWTEHLDQMTYLREGIGLQGYGQRDPLVEYKKEAFGLFTTLIANIQKQVVYSIFKMGDAHSLAPSPSRRQNHLLQGAKKTMDADKPMPAISHKIKTEGGKKVGRNDSCPCGSGKKYKKCHMNID
ncbi:MAG: preprotein translocase subunit SecA [bacterium]|nr:preprotein translocase subunit SecA [bacterium]